MTETGAKAVPRVTILGAGPAGIAAAHALTKSGKAQVQVLERAERAGGNSTSFQIEGIWCDYGSHRFHPVADPSPSLQMSRRCSGMTCCCSRAMAVFGWAVGGSIFR